jgi:hypothetical protein
LIKKLDAKYKKAKSGSGDGFPRTARREGESKESHAQRQKALTAQHYARKEKEYIEDQISQGNDPEGHVFNNRKVKLTQAQKDQVAKNKVMKPGNIGGWRKGERETIQFGTDKPPTHTQSSASDVSGANDMSPRKASNKQPKGVKISDNAIPGQDQIHRQIIGASQLLDRDDLTMQQKHQILDKIHDKATKYKLKEHANAQVQKHVHKMLENMHEHAASGNLGPEETSKLVSHMGEFAEKHGAGDHFRNLVAAKGKE